MNKPASPSTEIQQDQEALERFRFLLDFSDTPIAIYNLTEEHFVDANAAACRMMRLGRETLKHTSDDDVAAYLDVEFPSGITGLGSASKSGQTFQLCVADEYGEDHIYSIHTQPSAINDIEYVVLTAHNITDLITQRQVSAISRQRESKQREALTDLANNPIFTQGSLGDIYSVSIEALSTVLDPLQIDTWVRRRANNTQFTPIRSHSTMPLNTRLPEVQILLRELMKHVPIHIENVKTDPRTSKLVEILWPDRADSTVIFYPIHTAGILGSILAVWRPLTHTWHQDEIAFISNVGEYIGQGLRNFLGRRTVNDAASMSRMVLNMLSTSNIDMAIEEVARTAARVIDAANIAIFTLAPDNAEDIHVASLTLPDAVVSNLRQNLGECITHPDVQSTLLQGKPLMIYREIHPPASCVNNPILEPNFHQVMIMPMVRKEMLRGGIVVLYENPRRFMVGEISLMETLAQQSVSALEVTRLVIEQREQQSHLNLLFELNQLSTRSLDRAEIAQNALDVICRTFDAFFGLLAIQEHPEGDIKLLADHGIDKQRREFFRRHSKPNVGLAGTTIAQRQTIIIDDMLSDPYWTDIVSARGSGSWISVPLFIGQNAIASITLANKQVGYFTSKHEQLIKSAGAPLSTTLAYAQLIANEHAKLEAERNATALTEAAQQALDVLAAELDVDKVLDRVMDAVAGVVEADTYNIILIENDHGRIVRSQGYEIVDVDSADLANNTVQVFEFDNFKRMIRTGEPVITENTATDPHWVTGDSTRRGRAYIGVAIRIRDETVGFINASSFVLGKFNHEDARKLTLFAGYVALALRNARTFQRTSSYAADLEQRVTSRTHELELRTKWAEAMINSTSDGIIVLDTTHTQIQRNDVSKRLFTQTLSQMDVRILNTALDELVHQKLPAEAQVDLTGTVLELKASNIEDETEPAIIVTIHDITHLRAMDRMKSQFVSDVSHELRTPIATIGLYANLMRSHIDPQQIGYLDALNEEISALTRMVESILQVSRYESDRGILNPQPVNLNIVCTGAAGGFESSAQAKGIKFTLSLPDYPVDAYIDVSAFKHVINHLIENAIVYTDAGEITVSTAIRRVNGREWAVIAITDTGIGISKEEQEHIFERFYRGEVARQRQISGGGMGLALAQIITRQHGGHITVTSEVGRGSDFRVYLPTAQQ